jgi:hypothetical protein
VQRPGIGDDSGAMARAIGPGHFMPERTIMHQIFAILAAAFGFLTGGHGLQPNDVIPPIGAAQPASRPADGTLPIGMARGVRPHDVIPPIGDQMPKATATANAGGRRRPADVIPPIGM